MESQKTQIIGVLESPEGVGDLDGLIEHGLRLRSDGADIVDIDPAGGQGSSDHGAEPAISIVEALVRELSAAGVSVSVTTTDAATALAAVDNGADFIRDLSSGGADPLMPRVIVGSGARFIVGRGRVDELLEAGVGAAQLVIDASAGIPHQNDEWRILRHLADAARDGLPLLVNVAWRRLLDALVPTGAGSDARDAAAVAVGALSVEAGAWGIRVRNVARTAQALRPMLGIAPVVLAGAVASPLLSSSLAASPLTL